MSTNYPSPPKTNKSHERLMLAGLKPIIMSLSVGAVGGAVFSYLAVPLAWMLGPMIINIVASVSGAQVLIPHGIRVATLCLIGVFLGGSFSPELVGRLGEWIQSLALMLLFIPLITIVAGWYYCHFARFDRSTAMFSGAPGTLTAMVMIGGESGADERMVALAQGLRVVIVVLLMPLVVVALTSTSALSPSIVTAAGIFLWHDALLLAIAALVGFGLGHILKLPASAMTGAMLVSTALYLGGIVHWRPPDIFLYVCLWVLGSAIGSRFSTATPALFFQVSRHSIVATALIISLSAMFAALVSQLTGMEYLPALLSFTPGGVAEICLIAIAFHIDPATVAIHHLARIVVLITAAPFAAKWILSTHKID